MINLPRSTFYYGPAAANDGLNDGTLVELIERIQDELPGYGYIRWHNEKRIKISLGSLSPLEYRESLELTA